MNTSGFVDTENIITKEEPVDIWSSDLGDMKIITTEQQVEMYSPGSSVTEAIVAKGHLVKAERIIKDEEIIYINSGDLNMDTNTIKEELVETYFSEPCDGKECIMKKRNTRYLPIEEIMNEDSDDIFSEGDSSENKTGFIDISKIRMEDDIKPYYIDVERDLLLEELKDENSDGHNGITESQEAEHCVEEDSEDPETGLSDNIDNKRCEENPNQFNCWCCKFKGTYRKQLTRHLKRVHGIPLLSCHCGHYKTYYEDCLKKHQMKHDGNAKFECPQCQEVLSSKRNMENHILNKHDNFRDLVTSKIYHCNDCSYKTTNKSYLVHHNNIKHLKSKKYQCNYCPRTFIRRFSMKYHISSVHLNIRPYLCEGCNRKFTQKGALDRHIVSWHQDNVNLMKTVTIKIYSCDRCRYKCCNKNVLLVRHMKVHDKQ